MDVSIATGDTRKCPAARKIEQVLPETMAVVYRAAQLQARGLKQMAGVTGDIEDASRYARHFSPESNRAQDKGSPSYVSPAEELRVLVATAPGRRQHVGIVRFRRRGKARGRVMMCLRASLVMRKPAADFRSLAESGT
jgi:hypothetical protein